MKYIPSIVVAALMLCYPLASANAEFSVADTQFLKSCQVISADIGIIPQLSQPVPANVAKWISAKDCGSLGPLKATRAYYRKLKPNSDIPLAPAGWSIRYLTDAEFQNYLNILDSAPW